MALHCASCFKGVQYGHNVSHSKRRTNRTFKPNLQTAKVTVDGTTKRVKLCTKCLRMYKRVAIAATEAVLVPSEQATVAQAAV